MAKHKSPHHHYKKAYREYHPISDTMVSVALILIVYGEMIPFTEEFFVYTAPLQFPLFFTAVGYLLRDNDVSWTDVARKIFLWIIIPSLIFALIPTLWYIRSKGLDIIWQQLQALCVSSKFWLVPGSIIASTVFILCKKLSVKLSNTYVKNDYNEEWSMIFLGIMTIVIALVGYVLSINGKLTELHISKSLSMEAFIFFGNILQKYKRSIKKKNYGAVIIALLVLYLFLCWWKYYELPQFSGAFLLSGLIECVTTFSGLFLMFLVASQSKYENYWFYEIRHTILLIYIWQEPTTHLLAGILDYFNIMLPVGPMIGLGITIWCIVFCVLVKKIVLGVIGELFHINIPTV